MFRFTIRDVLWLTVVVAVGVAWWTDRASRKSQVREQASQWAEQATQSRTQKLASLNERVEAEAELEVQLVEARAEIKSLPKELASA